MKAVDRQYEPFLFVALFFICGAFWLAAETGVFDDRLLLLAASLIYVLSIGWMFISTVMNRIDQLSLFHVFALMTSIFFSSKAFVAWDEAVTWPAPLSLYVWTLALSQIGLLSAWGGERWFGSYFPKATLSKGISRLGVNANRKSVWAGFLLLIGIQLVAQIVLYQAGLFLSQFGVLDTDRAYWITSLNMLYPTLRLAVLGMAVVLTVKGGGTGRNFAKGVIAFEMFLAFISSRAALFIALMFVLTLMASLYAGTRFLRLHAWRAVILLFLAVGIAWPVYQHVRFIATPFFENNPNDDKIYAMVDVIIPEAVDTFNVASIYSSTSDYRTNVAVRLGGADFPAVILDAQNSGAPFMYGGSMASAILMIIPKFLFPGKIDANEEGEVIDHYGLEVTDHTSSPLGFALADFGVIGIIVYLFAFGVILKLFEIYLNSSATALTGLISFALIFPACVSIEGDLTAIFAILRIWLVVIIVGKIIPNDASTKVMIGGNLPHR